MSVSDDWKAHGGKSLIQSDIDQALVKNW